MSKTQSNMLYDTVISNGYCVGCGACASLDGSPFEVKMNKIGQYEAVMDRDAIITSDSIVEEVCPFSSRALTEDELSKDIFSSSCAYNSRVGYYQKNYAGYVQEGNFREKGSSGGFGTWILYELLKSGKVDYIINVQPSSSNDSSSEPLFKYTISKSIEELQFGSKSRYYPIELSGVIDQIHKQPGKYAIVGLPCFIKSIRLLQKVDLVIAERIKYCVGLVCGHLKSTRYAESLAWQSGVQPKELRFIDFRIKSPEKAANRYSTLIATSEDKLITPTDQLFGTDWGMGAFKYKACDFCDDVFAETADIVLGDAWLPQYLHDGEGTNVLVIRNQEISELIDNALNENRLVLDEISIKEVIASQDAGLRHRKDALSYRLSLEWKKKSWVPVKRNSLNSKISNNEKKRQDLRIKLRELSHSSFQNALDLNDFKIYTDAITPVYREYKAIKGSYLERAYAFLKRVRGFIKKKISSI